MRVLTLGVEQRAEPSASPEPEEFPDVSVYQSEVWPKSPQWHYRQVPFDPFQPWPCQPRSDRGNGRRRSPGNVEDRVVIIFEAHY
jgi:hypothetical protein